MVSDDALMTLFSQVVAWQNFTATIAVEAEIREAEYEAEVERVEAQALIDAWSNAGTVVGPRGGVKTDFSATIAKAQRDTSADVLLLREQFLKAKASRKRAQTVRDNCERTAALISRELSRRIGRDPVDRRVGRYTT